MRSLGRLPCSCDIYECWNLPVLFTILHHSLIGREYFFQKAKKKKRPVTIANYSDVWSQEEPDVFRSKTIFFYRIL